MRRALGEGYVDALRATWKEIPESADFVMHWWHIAAEAVRSGDTQQFGFITTNSIKQTFNRRVVQAQLEAKKNPLTLAFAIPDHPWVDAADGAQVRIAMTVGGINIETGRLLQVRDETACKNIQDEIDVTFIERLGKIFSDLNTGANIAGAARLQSNSAISSNGVMLAGSGFIVTVKQAKKLGLGGLKNVEHHIRKYRNGNDLLGVPREVMVIDLFGLTIEQVNEEFPAIYQHVLENVKPTRDQNNRPRLKNKWWIFGEPRQGWREMSSNIDRFFVTVETSKHRCFLMLNKEILPDHRLIAFGISDSYDLGVLSSRIHILWGLSSGGTLESRPVYNKTRCFETFPFPDPSEDQKQSISQLAERLDAHRKRQQELHPELTLTNMYNVLEKLRSGEPLTAKEKSAHEHGLVSVLRELHDDLDRAVFDAYGWNDLAEQLVGLPGATTPLPDKPEAQAAAEEELLKRLVELNAQRAAEEAQGHIRWLRPDYQNPQGRSASQTSLDTSTDDSEAADTRDTPAASTDKISWPKTMREQITAVRAALGSAPQTLEQLAEHFKRKPVVAVQSVLDALQELGMVAEHGGIYTLGGASA